VPDAAAVWRADRVFVPICRDDPMSTLCQLVQEYLCILQKYRDKHVLTTADLYFPASWTLAEKLRHPLSRLHVRVDRYDTDVWRRAQRLLEGV